MIMAMIKTVATALIVSFVPVASTQPIIAVSTPTPVAERSMIAWALKTHARYPARFESLRADPTLSHVAFHRVRRPREATDLVHSVERTFG